MASNAKLVLKICEAHEIGTCSHHRRQACSTKSGQGRRYDIFGQATTPADSTPGADSGLQAPTDCSACSRDRASFTRFLFCRRSFAVGPMSEGAVRSFRSCICKSLVLSFIVCLLGDLKPRHRNLNAIQYSNIAGSQRSPGATTGALMLCRLLRSSSSACDIVASSKLYSAPIVSDPGTLGGAFAAEGYLRARASSLLCNYKALSLAVVR